MGDDRYKQDFDRDLAGDAEVKSYEYECPATNAAVKGRLKGKLVISHMSRTRLWRNSTS